MLSVHRIDRHFRGRQFEPLLAAIEANGLELPLPLRARLLQTPVAAVALGLMRLLELTYGPTSLAREMIDALLHFQRSDGSFEGDPLATAAAVAALARCTQDRALAQDGRLAAGYQRGLDALAHMQADDALFTSTDDRSWQDRTLAAAFIVLLLGADPGFRAAVRYAQLMTWFEQHRRRLDPAARELWRLARVQTTGPQTPAPAAAAAA
jgi:hypothetical protein